MPPAIRYERVSANGLSFNVATAGEGDRLALCLHGFPENSYSFRAQLPLFARLGYRAWAPDLRGYGKTTRPLGIDAYAIEKLEADVAGLIDAAKAREVVLVGHDWGGGIAWSFAAHSVRPIDRLIVMNCPHPICFEKGLRKPAQLRRSWYMFFFQLPIVPEWYLGARRAERVARAFRGMAVDKSRFPDDVLDVYRDAASEPGALTAMINYYRAMFRGIRRARHRGFDEITIPTLLIWGEEDTALGKELTFETGRYVRNLAVRYLPGVSHWVQQEAPEAVNALIEEWLAPRR